MSNTVMRNIVDLQDVVPGHGEARVARGWPRRWIGRLADRLRRPMSRISIEVTTRQHARLKSLAAREGLSLKALVLLRTLGEASVDTDLDELEGMLDERIARSEAAGTRRRTVGAIFRQARKRAHRATDA
jgi:hypothetical protein